MSKKGLIHIYCGDGKGKTTASMGLSIRAAGRGFRVLITQFLKGRDTGELKSLSLIPGITLVRAKASEKFTFQMTEQELQEAHDQSMEALKNVFAQANNGECDLLILDELLGALSCKLIDEDLLSDFLDHKPEELEVVMTGRNPPQWLLDKADYVTEMCMRKHPYEQGVPARKGIEF